MESGRTIRIEARYCGPPRSGNGGYVCGTLAEHRPGTVQVKYKQPAPLDEDLKIISDESSTSLRRGSGETLAVARTVAELKQPLPEPIGFEEAQTASQSYAGFQEHAFPTCFVCGPGRSAGDGLRIFPGAVKAPGDFTNLVAAPWMLDESLCDESGTVLPAVLWAALDCPGYFAVALGEPRVMVLASLCAEIYERPRLSAEKLVVMGWEEKRQSRSAVAGTALFDAESGKVLARASGKWMIPKNWDPENIDTNYA